MAVVWGWKRLVLFSTAREAKALVDLELRPEDAATFASLHLSLKGLDLFFVLRKVLGTKKFFAVGVSSDPMDLHVGKRGAANVAREPDIGRKGRRLVMIEVDIFQEGLDLACGAGSKTFVGFPGFGGGKVAQRFKGEKLHLRLVFEASQEDRKRARFGVFAEGFKGGIAHLSERGIVPVAPKRTHRSPLDFPVAVLKSFVESVFHIVVGERREGVEDRDTSIEIVAFESIKESGKKGRILDLTKLAGGVLPDLRVVVLKSIEES